MALYDLTGPELESYRPVAPPPADFGAFWDETLAQAEAEDIDATFVKVDNGLTLIDTYDVTFRGFGGDQVRAWLQLPAGASDRRAAIVEFVGYGGGRGLAHENLVWAAAGYAHMIMDTRGQGSTWRVGDTPDPVADGAPAHPGFLTRGIRDRYSYYYRRLFTDAVRAVQALRRHPNVDPVRVVAKGTSQGGGIALAVAGLVSDLAAVLPDVPFLCDFRRATSLVDSHPYVEIANYLKVHRDAVDEVFTTLAYFDGALFAQRGRAPALFSVALMDQICPPSTVYGAYNLYAGPKEIRCYPYNDHEGGAAFHEAFQLRWLRHLLS